MIHPFRFRNLFGLIVRSWILAVPALVARGQEESDPEIRALEERFEEERSAAWRSVLARYVDALAGLQATLLKSGDTTSAARVQVEIDRVRPAVQPALADSSAGLEDIFRDPSAPPAPALDSAAPIDLTRIVEAMKSPESANPAAGAGERIAAASRSGRRLLRMSGATLAAGADRSPDELAWYWAVPGRQASWTVTDLPAGSYRVTLRYSGSPETGGKIRVKAGHHTSEVAIDPVPSTRRTVERNLGPFALHSGHVDLDIKSLELRENAGVLFQLESVLLAPGPTDR